MGNRRKPVDKAVVKPKVKDEGFELRLKL